MRPMPWLVLALLAGGLFGESGCGTTTQVDGDSWGSQFDIHFSNPDQSSDPDWYVEVSTKEGLEEATASDVAPEAWVDLGADHSGPDAHEVLSDHTPLPDQLLPDQQYEDVQDDDQEEPAEVVVTPCGVCPVQKPLCTLGKCSCDAAAGSCGEGTYCHASGECLPCDSDSHCGPECLKCADVGASFFCAEDSSGCIECDSTFGCPLSQTCVDGSCEACSSLGLCGPYCLSCSGQTPDCVSNKCACNASSCGASAVCEYGSCVACTSNDAAHCGSSCAVCSGANPHCKSGACALCNSNAFCGPTCSACPSETPVCRPDGAGCVQCLYTTDCPDGQYCTPLATCGQCLNDSHCLASEYCGGYQCLPDKPLTACPGDSAPDGTTCGNAKIIARTAVAGTNANFSGATTYSGTDNDDASCSDGGNERFYRIYLEPLDQVTVKLSPSSYYDAVLKVYVGSDCDDNGTSDLVVCKDQQAGGVQESYSFQAVTAGWYSIVVDGVSTANDDDYGSFTLNVALSCTLTSCNCP